MHETIKIRQPQVAIVHFKSEELLESMGKRLVYYQVTLLPEGQEPYYSPKGDFVYFGGVEGDQITGWQPTNDIVLDETLHVYADSEVIPYLKRTEVKQRELRTAHHNV